MIFRSEYLRKNDTNYPHCNFGLNCQERKRPDGKTYYMYRVFQHSRSTRHQILKHLKRFILILETELKEKK